MTDRRTLLDDMTDDERKAVPLAALFDYFPDGLIAVAQIIASGQTQHGTPTWNRAKSNDHRNTLLRHFLQAGTKEADGSRHSAKVVWRGLAALQLEIEAERAEAARKKRRRKARTARGASGPGSGKRPRTAKR